MMEDLLRVLFLLCAFAAPGHSLSCLKCVAKDSTCKGVSEECYNACGLVFQETIEDGKTSRDYMKTCIEKEHCDKVGSISHISGTKRIGISCCYTDNCTPSLPKLPANSPKANGMTCPTCRDTKRSSCTPQTNIKCSGNERMCVNHYISSTTRTQGEENMVGCSTQSICNMNIRHDLGDSYLNLAFYCDPGTPETESDVPLSCFQCAKTNSTCQGFKVTCPPNHSCGLTYLEMTEDGKVNTDYIKSCVPTEKCNKTGSITHLNGTMKMGISCCDTDSCTPLLPQWPADSSKANGLSCPTCRDLKNSKCNPESELQCAGSEQMCVAQSTETAGVKESAMGCATKSVCDIKSYSYKNDPSFINMDFSCDPKIGNPKDQPSQGAPLMCVLCRAEDSLECEGILEFCPTNQVCASSYRVTASAANTTSSIARSCVPEDKCNIFGTMSITGKRFATGTSCCKEDGCTPSIAPWKSKLARPNGVKCKTCLSSYSDSCETADTLDCRGDEKQCVSYAVTMSTDFDSAAFSFRGCGTKALCEAQNYLMIINDVEFNHRFTCT